MKYKSLIFLVVFIAVFWSCSESIQIDVLIVPERSGIVSIEPNKPLYAWDEEITLTANPALGKQFNYWSVNDEIYYDDELVIPVRYTDDITANFTDEVQSSRGWLVMIYFAASNNLEPEAIYDMSMISLGLSGNDTPEDITVVALYDGLTIMDSRMYRITSAGVNEVTGWWDGIETELDMGDVGTFKKFIFYTTGQYDSIDKHALILWNHGAGARTVSPDPVSETDFLLSAERSIANDEDTGAPPNDILYLDELQQALSSVYSPDNKLDFLGFDACLMGTVEVAYEFRNLATVMSGAPSSVFGGWAYSELFSMITRDTTASQFGQYSVQTFRQKALSNSSSLLEEENSQTAVDLTKIGALKSAVDSFAAAVGDAYNDGAAPSVQTSFESAREDSVEFYSLEPYEIYSVSYPYYDMYSFFTNYLNSNYLNSNIYADAEAQAVLDALDDTVISFWQGSERGDRESGDGNSDGGLSIFIPRGNRTYQTYSHYVYHWWYTHLETNPLALAEGRSGGYYYGKIDFADSNSNGTVETWRELFEIWYDGSDTYTWGSY